jgi:hypothetical protein
MLRALLRYLLFEVPVGFIKGLSFIIFDKDEIIGTHFTVDDQVDKAAEENRILVNYLNRCRKQVYKKGK